MGREHFLLIPLVDMSCDLLLWWYDQLPGFDINLCLTETLGQLPAYLDSLLREVNLRLRMFHHTCCLYCAPLSFRTPTLPYVSSWPLRWYDMDIGYQIYVWWNGWSSYPPNKNIFLDIHISYSNHITLSDWCESIIVTFNKNLGLCHFRYRCRHWYTIHTDKYL